MELLVVRLVIAKVVKLLVAVVLLIMLVHKMLVSLVIGLRESANRKVKEDNPHNATHIFDNLQEDLPQLHCQGHVLRLRAHVVNPGSA